MTTCTSACSCQVATARCPSLGPTAFIIWCRHRYHAHTFSGWRRHASELEISYGSTLAHSPVSTSRKVGTPLSADIPAPLSTVTCTTTKLAASCKYGAVANLGEWVRIDGHGAKPLFDQLRTQIIGGVREGRLAPGTRLPTVRELAADLGMAVNTVARAYRELESAGVVETRGRFGTFVARADPADAALATAAHAFVSTARAHGVGKGDALVYVDAAFG